MELWHWHPIFVHFAVALLFTASVLFLVAALWRGKTWMPMCLNAARWNFWLGIVMAAGTAVTGFIPFNAPPATAEFNLVVLDTVLPKLANACKWETTK